jgi:hypothetical protein
MHGDPCDYCGQALAAPAVSVRGEGGALHVAVHEACALSLSGALTRSVAERLNPSASGFWVFEWPVECPAPGCESRDVHALAARMMEGPGGEVGHMAFACPRHVFTIALQQHPASGRYTLTGKAVADWTPLDDVGVEVTR